MDFRPSLFFVDVERTTSLPQKGKFSHLMVLRMILLRYL